MSTDEMFGKVALKVATLSEKDLSVIYNFLTKLYGGDSEKVHQALDLFLKMSPSDIVQALSEKMFVERIGCTQVLELNKPFEVDKLFVYGSFISRLGPEFKKLITDQVEPKIPGIELQVSKVLVPTKYDRILNHFGGRKNAEITWGQLFHCIVNWKELRSDENIKCAFIKDIVQPVNFVCSAPRFSGWNLWIHEVIKNKDVCDLSIGHQIITPMTGS